MNISLKMRVSVDTAPDKHRHKVDMLVFDSSMFHNKANVIILISYQHIPVLTILKFVSSRRRFMCNHVC